MPDAVTLAKAKLIELEDDISTRKSGGKEIEVQFNPETLKVTFTNQVQTPAAQGNNNTPPPPRQVFGTGSTKLALQLWFDVSAPQKKERAKDDVRKLTEEVAYFMIPQERSYGLVPPAISFLWGTFQFDGVMDSLEESLEFFSPEGRPLRASVSVSLSQPKIDKYKFGKAKPGAGGGGGGAGGGPGKGGAPLTPGTKPLAQASAGMSFQAMADLNGVGANWQAHASANGIENPRALTPGQFVSFNASASAGASSSFNASASTDGGTTSVEKSFTKSASFNKSF
ncbi:MAG TPA: hypothetical protein VIW80_21620 [Pyrinomonadaceae bacterium]|jgi:hypothetical protein